MLCCLAGTATQRRGYNRFNASTLQLFNLGLPIRVEVAALAEALVSECLWLLSIARCEILRHQPFRQRHSFQNPWPVPKRFRRQE